MEMLFNTEFSVINLDSLYENLKTSPLSDVQAEDDIIESIEQSQLIQGQLLETAYAYYENILKYSGKNIETNRRHIFLSDAVPTILATTFELTVGDNTDLLDGLLKRDALVSSYQDSFWMFRESVYLQNENYSTSSSNGNLDILATEEMMDYYFLTKKSGQTLYRCTAGVIGNLTAFSSIPSGRALSYADIRRVYFRKDETLNMSSKVLHVSDFTITTSSISIDSMHISPNNVASRILSGTGTVTLGDVGSKFIPFDNPRLGDSASLEYVDITNAKSIMDVSDTLDQQKAPFVDWEPVDLRKTDEKSDAFKNRFVELLLSGNSIPEDDINDYRSLVSKKELLDILEILGEAIVNMDICDDN